MSKHALIAKILKRVEAESTSAGCAAYTLETLKIVLTEELKGILP